MNEYKKSAVDLTDLAIGIVVLGVAVSIGGTVLITYRDTHLTDLTTYTTANETENFALPGGKTLANGWFNSITSVVNTSNGVAISSGNYTVTTDGLGIATITNTTRTFPHSWNITYSSYNTSSRPDYTIADDAATGIAEYGNWFKIIVIVGVAALILSLIFASFGRGREESAGVSY